jgi:hypothetical protein
MRFVRANVRIFPGLSIFGRSFLNLGSEVQVLSGTPLKSLILLSLQPFSPKAGKAWKGNEKASKSHETRQKSHGTSIKFAPCSRRRLPLVQDGPKEKTD